MGKYIFVVVMSTDPEANFTDTEGMDLVSVKADSVLEAIAQAYFYAKETLEYEPQAFSVRDWKKVS